MHVHLLSDILDADQLIALAEIYGGTRLSVPQKAGDNHPLVQAVGREGFEKLSEAYGYDVIRVPICRELRINHYRAGGLSNGEIAIRLTMTEPGVSKAIQRLKQRGELLPKLNKPRSNVRKAQAIGSRCLCCHHYSPDRRSAPPAESAV
ncbi:MAG: hypothetical protein ABIV36_13745 [Sphingobium limneticum]